jgi:hypothetical protein
VSNYEYLFGDIPLLKADRSPCPICGHPTGDCIPENHQPPQKIFGIGLFASLDKEQMFTIDKDIFEDRQIAPRQIIKVLKYRKGHQIPLSTARELGLTE